MIMLVASWNRGKGRIMNHRVMGRGMKVHRSVKTRLSVLGNERGDLYWPEILCEIKGKIRRPTIDEWSADDPEFFKWVK